MEPKNISLPDRIRDELETEAERLGISEAEIARNALIEYLEV